jgi:iron complex transport system substrate-binding protein
MGAVEMEREQEPSLLVGEIIPRRIVSLVPSYTESLFDLGFGDSVVGVSDFCVRPEPEVRDLTRVGGPKTARVADILKLRPDLVIANREENSREVVETLEKAGIPVWLNFPLSVQDTIDDLFKIARLFRSEEALKRVQLIERSVEWVRLASEDREPTRYFCPIWQDRLETGMMWWMTFNESTYTHDLLALIGGENVFAGRKRRYPLLAEFGFLPEEDPNERDTRYPRVTQQEVIDGMPEVIVLPDEPYSYKDADRASFAGWFANTQAVQQSKILMVDGSLITWYGTRLAAAIQELPHLFDSNVIFDT